MTRQIFPPLHPLTGLPDTTATQSELFTVGRGKSRSVYVLIGGAASVSLEWQYQQEPALYVAVVQETGGGLAAVDLAATETPFELTAPGTYRVVFSGPNASTKAFVDDL